MKLIKGKESASVSYVLTYTGNTTNMWNHLQVEHTQDFRQAKASDESNGAAGRTVNSNMSVFLADNLK